MTSRVPYVPFPTYSQPFVQHSAVAVATELQCCFVLGRRIAVGYTFVYYVIIKGLYLREPSRLRHLSTHEVAYGAIDSDRHDLSTFISRQGIS